MPVVALEDLASPVQAILDPLLITDQLVERFDQIGLRFAILATTPTRYRIAVSWLVPIEEIDDRA